MRTILFTLFILLLVGVGAWLKWGNKEASVKIIPYSEWHKILPGEWEYKWKWKSPQDVWFFNGRIEFLSDGTYDKHISIMHNRDTDERNEYINFITGGNITGNWEIDTVKGSWAEITKTCKLMVDDKFADSEYIQIYNNNTFIKQNYQYFGNHKQPDYDLQVIEFNKDKIVMHGKGYVDNSEREFVWERKK